MKLPTLFKRTSSGALQEWTVTTEGNVIVIRWGQTGGSIQEARDVIKEGKNVGRANETTPVQQAELEARALWEQKKKKRGYVETKEAAMAGEVDAVVAGGIAPMLAHRYDERGHKMTWPAFAQAKFDGHRCIVVVQNGAASLWSRTRKPITGVPHIARAFEELGIESAVFDGELYEHSYRDHFEELTSFIRQETPKSGHEVVQYHCYDYPSHGGAFFERHAALRKLDVRLTAASPIRLVETEPVEDEDELMAAFERFLKLGYEGAMVRSRAGLYEPDKRSEHLLKVKTFEDHDWPVIDVEEGRGKLAGHGIFVCQMANGARFRAKMIGNTSELRKFWEHPDLAIGRVLTVKHQKFTKEGLPRFPIAVRFRDDA